MKNRQILNSQRDFKFFWLQEGFEETIRRRDLEIEFGKKRNFLFQFTGYGDSLSMDRREYSLYNHIRSYSFDIILSSGHSTKKLLFGQRNCSGKSWTGCVFCRLFLWKRWNIRQNIGIRKCNSPTCSLCYKRNDELCYSIEKIQSYSFDGIYNCCRILPGRAYGRNIWPMAWISLQRTDSNGFG